MEKETQDYIINKLQKNKIDFLRIKNQGFKGKSASSKSYAVFPLGESCDKFISDLLIPHNGTLYLVEFGVSGRHKDRKEKQRLRCEYWEQNINAEFHLIESKDQAISFWLNKIEPKQTQDDIDQTTIEDYL